MISGLNPAGKKIPDPGFREKDGQIKQKEVNKKLTFSA